MRQAEENDDRKIRARREQDTRIVAYADGHYHVVG